VRLVSRAEAHGRGVLGMLALAIGLGMASAVGDIGEVRLGMSGTARQALQGLVCSAVTVALIVLLRRRLDRRSLQGLGLPGVRESLRTFGLGVLATAAAAAVVFGLGAAVGWLRLTVVSWSTILGFLVTNTAIAFLFEALPEELALRGYTYRNLNVRLRRWTASILTIALFLLAPGAASVVQAAVMAMVAGRAASIGLTPAGMDPVSYLVLLTVFGAALIAARIATGSLWACIGLHLTFLAVNRTVLAGEVATGVSASMATPDAILLIPGYVLLAAGGFLAVARLRGRRIGWRDRNPE
jgi:membrane protease YdiL (CAAX protease family)